MDAHATDCNIIYSLYIVARDAYFPVSSAAKQIFHLRSALASSAAAACCLRSTSICSLWSRSVWRKRVRRISAAAACLPPRIAHHHAIKAE